MKHSTAVFVLITVLGLAAGCYTTPTNETDREVLDLDAKAAVARMDAKDPSFKKFLDRTAYGYVVFPSIGKGGLIVGGAYGRGVVYEKGAKVGYADLTQGSIGLQAGGQSYTQVVVFESKDTLLQFKANQLTFSANASAVAVKAGAGAATQFMNGVAVFTDSESGLMGEASVGGQQFRYQGK